MNTKKNLQTVAGVLFGNLLLAFCVSGFIIPHGLVMGGATGVGLTINHYLPYIDLSTIIFILNSFLFILGAWQLGRKFALNTIISTIMYPVFLRFCNSIPQLKSLTDNTLLATIYAGILLGIGIGIVIRVGASTGGTDILALVINKLTHSPVAICMYAVDFAVIAFQMFFSSTEQVLYGVLVLIITTLVLNKVTVFGQSQIQLFIISEKFEDIKATMLKEISAGVTMVKIKTGFSEKDQEGVLCVIPRRKLYAANEIVQKLDDKAFITISEINEVRGRGFSFDRNHKS